jgi:phytoene/squalene synthetase
MSEPTPEQKQKTIRLARQMYRNMWEQQLGPALQEFVEMQRELQALHRNAPWAPKPRPQVVPQVDPAEQKLLEEVLTEAARKGK